MAESSRMRIGDAERDDAVALLGEHLAAGRVDYAEFEQRAGVVLAARTQGELDAVFDDLPGRRPGGDASPAGLAGPVGRGGQVPVRVGERGVLQLAGPGGRCLQAGVVVAMVTVWLATVWWLVHGAAIAPFMLLNFWWMGSAAWRGRGNHRRGR